MIIPLLSLFGEAESAVYLRHIQTQMPGWISPHMRKHLRAKMYRRESLLTHPGTHLGSSWLALRSMMPTWDQVYQKASMTPAPAPGSCDLLVGLGDAGGVLADALMHSWRERGLVDRSTHVFHMEIGGSFPFKDTHIGIGVVDAYGYYSNVIEDLAERAGHTVAGVWLWSDLLGYRHRSDAPLHMVSAEPMMLPVA